MHIIYSGGYNNQLPESRQASFIYTYREAVLHAVSRGKKAAFITMAKPDGYYDGIIRPLYGDKIDVVGFANAPGAVWDSYDILFLFGGKTAVLLGGLRANGFSLEKLKTDAVVLGDSAGSYALSAFCYNSPPGQLRGIEIEFLPAMNPASKVITVAHRNNPIYCNDILLGKVDRFAREKQLRVLVLRENEQKLLENGEFVDFDREALFA